MPENNQILSVEGQLVGMPLAGPESFSAQQLNYLKRALGVDETVLWDKGSGASLGNGTDTATLSETMSNFEFVRFEAEWQTYATDSDRTNNFVCKVFRPKPVRFAIDSMCGYGSATNTMYSAVSRFNINASLTEVSFLSKVCWLATDASTGISLGPVITKVVGIHRISGGN